MLYQFYEFSHASLKPLRIVSGVTRRMLQDPKNPFGDTGIGKAMAAGLEVFEDVTNHYTKAEWQISTKNGDGSTAVEIAVEHSLPFCKLRSFKVPGRENCPRVLLVAPLSGHYATLLSDTIETLIMDFDVYITDWEDSREIPAKVGDFGLDDYINYILTFMEALGPKYHVVAVCQPGPAVLVASATLAADKSDNQPSSIVLMGSPIDTRKSPTKPNQLAKNRSLRWFKANAIMKVPLPHAGHSRPVYPGFLQLTGFMTMNLERHLYAHKKLFDNLVRGDGDSVEAHRKFYKEYLAVMDLPSKYYLDTIEKIFQKHDLPNGKMRFNGNKIDLTAIIKPGLMTIEGGKDDISGVGQTQAAHDLCTNISEERRVSFVHPEVGHYGVFNGRKWRNEIAPRVREFILENDAIVE